MQKLMSSASAVFAGVLPAPSRLHSGKAAGVEEGAVPGPEVEETGSGVQKLMSSAFAVIAEARGVPGLLPTCSAAPMNGLRVAPASPVCSQLSHMVSPLRFYATADLSPIWLSHAQAYSGISDLSVRSSVFKEQREGVN